MLFSPIQSVKEPLFSLSENRGVVIFRCKYKQDLSNNGVVPTPICQFFQVHGSVFKPDPSRDCGQASVVCISHGVLLFRIRKDTLNRLFALCIDFLCTLRLSDLLYQIQVLLPNVGCEYFLPLFIGSASCSAGAVPAFLRSASVRPLAVPVCGSVPQHFVMWTNKTVCHWVISIIPGFIAFLVSFISCIGQNPEFPVIHRFLCNPRSLISGIHCYELYIMFASYIVIYLVPCYTVMNISGSYFYS